MPVTMPGRVQLHDEGAIARVVLSHPGKLNAMSRAMWRELREVFLAVQAGTWRCVLVEGEGAAFCAGGDISEYPQFRFEESTLREFHETDVWGGLQAMLDCEVPLVAAIRGPCMGAGLEIASCCDIRLAAATAQFGAPIARLGFPMAPREAQLVAAAAGDLTAREMLLEAAVLDAGQMKQRGFVNDVVEETDLPARVLASTQRITALAPQAARLNKRTLRALPESNQAAARMVWTQHATEKIAKAYCYAPGAEHREGIAAFLEKRKPAF